MDKLRGPAPFSERLARKLRLDASSRIPPVEGVWCAENELRSFRFKADRAAPEPERQALGTLVNILV